MTVDITGKRFGRYIVIRKTNQRKNGGVVWECRCDCGETRFNRTADLTTGRSQSCGCRTREAARKNAPLGKHGLKTADKNNCVEKTDLRSLKRELRNNTSGKTGVCWNTGHQKWQARIGFQGKTHHLGYFTEYDEAVKARTEAEKELHEPILERYGRKRQ